MTWKHVNAALSKGDRGLPGGMTLTQVFGRPVRRRPAQGWVKLTIPEILAWADAHHAATGRWPSAHSGPIKAAPYPETWRAVDVGLSGGGRGLPGGSSLSRLLQEQRGYTPKMKLEGARAREEKSRAIHTARSQIGGRVTLSIEGLLEAADAHHKATGRWPNMRSGPIPSLPGETWSTVNRALRLGLRGLPGGTSLKDLLTEQRGMREHGLPELTVQKILRWADTYQQAHGSWPDDSSGPVAESPADTWYNIDKILGRGGRGLAGHSSLRRLLAEHRGVRYKGMEPVLSPDQIVAWAEAHRVATGEWPTSRSGKVGAAPDETWSIIDYALVHGRRGLPGGSSLARLLAEYLPAYSRVLTLEMIIAWGETHYAAHGRWPSSHSGAVIGAPGEKWGNLHQALRSGNRGLPAGMSLTKLFSGCPAPARVDGASQSP
jgi:hypothetical protein